MISSVDDGVEFIQVAPTPQLSTKTSSKPSRSSSLLPPDDKKSHTPSPRPQSGSVASHTRRVTSTFEPYSDIMDRIRVRVTQHLVERHMYRHCYSDEASRFNDALGDSEDEDSGLLSNTDNYDNSELDDLGWEFEVKKTLSFDEQSLLLTIDGMIG